MSNGKAAADEVFTGPSGKKYMRKPIPACTLCDAQGTEDCTRGPCGPWENVPNILTLIKED